MAYSDFTLEAAETRLELTTDFGDLFPGLRPVAVSGSLAELLAGLTSENLHHEWAAGPPAGMELL
jgi:hypothetical protein